MSDIKEFIRKYKNSGGFRKALQEVKQKLGIKEDSFKSWKGIFELAQRNCALSSFDNEFFVSEEAKIIFALTHLDGEMRAEMLGIERGMYSSLDEAKKWYRRLASILHPDRCKHPRANEALAQLNAIYKRMKKHGE